MSDDGFGMCLDAAFAGKFGVKLETRWNIFDMRLVSSRQDGDALTEEQASFINGFSEGWRLKFS